MSPMCFSILHVMADLQGLFLRSFVRNLDRLCTAYWSVHRVWKNDWQTSKVLAVLSEDGNGNILFVKADSSGKEHNIMWQVSSRTNQRNKGQI